LAVLGELSVKRGIAALGNIVASRGESSLTKAYAATALGHIGGTSAIQALAGAMDDKDDMVRRQVAKSLARMDRVEAVPHLLKLRQDRSVVVSEIATEAVQRWEKKLNQTLGKFRKAPAARKQRKTKVAPAADQ
jgi:HEAT repeat protein